jgi:hypothetical protein
MYKKRFAKWGFYKNKRRVSLDSEIVDDSLSSCSTANTSTTHLVPESIKEAHLVLTPKSSDSDRASLAFLTSIRTWSSLFFESRELTLPADPAENSLVGPYRPKGLGVYDPEKLSYTFRVVAGLLTRGHGVLAGRLARKAFLQVEGILDIEGPLYIWNVLEILFNMISLGHVQLFEMLIGHLISLARTHYAESHPVVEMSRSLQRLVIAWRREAVPFQTTALEQAWALNANILLNSFDTSLVMLYHRLVWDSTLVNLSIEKQWVVFRGLSELHAMLPTEDVYVDMATDIYQDLIKYESADGTRAPKNYAFIKADTFTTIRELSTMDFTDVGIKIKILDTLLTTKAFIQGSSPSSTVHGDARNDVPLVDARLLAHLIKTLVSLDLEADRHVAIERMNNVIALREYGQSTFDPQIMHELWQLEDLLLNEGRLQEAIAVQQDVYKRLDEYLDDIPAYMA